jgi:uncharacterized protein (TIGR00369 family)
MISRSMDPRPGVEPTAFDRLAAPSPFRAMCGIRIVEWEAGRCVIDMPPMPHLMNSSGVLAGAVLAAAVDMAGSLSGCFSTDAHHLHAVTLSLTTGYIGAAAGPVRAVGSLKGGGRRIFNSTVDVFDAAGALVATGQGTFRYIPGGR